MALIDASYFVGELDIPNTDREEIQERLALFIPKYENEILLDLLGYELSRDFIAGLAAIPITEQWLRLRDGFEYRDRFGRLTKWRGFVETNPKRSLIANFIYYFWMKDQATQSVGLGEVATKAENATVVSPQRKMIRAWNEMVDGILAMRMYLDDPKTFYAGWNNFYSQRLSRKYRYINEFGI